MRFGKRVAAGLKIKGIATSERSHQQALSLAIPMTDFAHTPKLDICIDGADEVEEGTLFLLKGAGGALLREKLVAMTAARFLVAVDPRKIVQSLGSVFLLPVRSCRSPGRLRPAACATWASLPSSGSRRTGSRTSRTGSTYS